MKTTTTILATLFATALSGAAFAQDSELPSFAELDANADGAISQDEAAAAPAVVEQWTALDVNGDGQVTEDEYAAMAGQS